MPHAFFCLLVGTAFQFTATGITWTIILYKRPFTIIDSDPGPALHFYSNAVSYTHLDVYKRQAKGGIFGVEKADWVAELEKQNPLKAAEMSLEDDYGMIDGIINNGPKEDKSSEKGGKASIMDRLKSAKTAQQTDKPSPHKEKKSEREL